MLTRAKKRSAAVQNSAPAKKTKTKCGDKPTLVISRKQGEYTVEMHVTSDKDNNCVVYDPLVYRIASATNDEKVKRREKKAKKLIRTLMKDLNDPFHPDACQQTCVPSYRAAVGLPRDAPAGPRDAPAGPGDARSEASDSCSCEYDELETDGSSLDLDWEIQFSPPNAHAKS